MKITYTSEDWTRTLTYSQENPVMDSIKAWFSGNSIENSEILIEKNA